LPLTGTRPVDEQPGNKPVASRREKPTNLRRESRRCESGPVVKTEKQVFMFGQAVSDEGGERKRPTQKIASHGAKDRQADGSPKRVLLRRRKMLDRTHCWVRSSQNSQKPRSGPSHVSDQ
jgi:hypothetical protein